MIAFLAGAESGTALRLGAAMLSLQVSIGALNDAVDAPRDAGRKLGKPIPRGASSVGEALGVAGLALVVGLVLTLPSGPPAVAVALAGVACGYAYDLGLSRTAWSWLPFAIALPLVPIYAWVGSAGRLPPELLTLLPIGLLAGGGLALSNGLADLERDLLAGGAPAAVRLGPRRAWWLHLALLGGAVILGIVLLPAGNATAPTAPLVPVGLGVGAVLAALGAGLAGAASPSRRERGWELEAIGVALLGASWVAALAGG